MVRRASDGPTSTSLPSDGSLSCLTPWSWRLIPTTPNSAWAEPSSASLNRAGRSASSTSPAASPLRWEASSAGPPRRPRPTPIWETPGGRTSACPTAASNPTLANRRALAAVFRQVRPRLIFAPYWEDAHPDHLAATKLVEDARFWSKLSKSDIPGEPFHPARILYYFSVHLRIVERPSLVLDVSDQIDAKIAAMRSLPLAARRQPAPGSAGGDRIGLRPHPVLGPHGGRPPRRAVRQPRARRPQRSGCLAALSVSFLPSLEGVRP